MGASAGRYGVSIGTGAAGGAGAGAAFGGPIGAVVGGGIGALGGALSTLLSSSDEAKQRKKALEAYKQQQLEAAQNDWDRRWVALTGGSELDLPLKPYDPNKAEADFNAHTPDEPTPNYGALVQSLGSLGGTVGALGRQSDLQDKLGLAQINATRNPWQADASTTDPGLEKLLEQARQAAWNRTGGW